jgi:hypothetical protein
MIEQSGVLHQLPGMLTSNLSALQSSGMTDDKSPDITLAPVRLSGQIFVQLQLLRGLQHLHSSLPAAHAASCAGQQFVVPGMQVCMSSVQHISTAYTQAGRQEWMEHWLGMVATAANRVLQSFMLQQKSGSSNRANSSSSQQGATLAALQ